MECRAVNGPAADIAEDYRQQREGLTAMSLGAIAARLRPDYGKRRRRPAARQSCDTDSPARSGAYAASLRDTNSVNSRTRFVLRVSPCVRSQTVSYMCR